MNFCDKARHETLWHESTPCSATELTGHSLLNSIHVIFNAKQMLFTAGKHTY